MTKEQIREIMLAILDGSERTKYCVGNLDNLLAGVAEVEARKSGKQPQLTGYSMRPSDPELVHDDALLAMDVFWDLIIERRITPGSRLEHTHLPDFHFMPIERNE